MIYDKDSLDYQVNWVAFHEMDACVPMTKRERNALRRWVKRGHEIESNPWHYLDADGYPMNYLQAYRMEYGCSVGPWDAWKGF